ncbi:hypothetical protein C480_09180 [Natrialba aegyptia DSM 13077]|uniref:YdbS-like PH domain-containing protein n=1 Tax=Natrialba aegyptia DSM 13077 TaxID=1227491 RepID=M0BA47_9EURY|nr:hypothetical protein C480_09180 [Natrialba aegyptia DSM 13077]
MGYNESGTGKGESGSSKRSNSETSSESAESEPFLLNDETVIVDVRPTWWGWTGYIALASMLLGLGLLLSFVEFAVGMMAVIPGVLLAGYVWYQRSRHRYLVTDRRIIVVSGLWTRTTTETWVEDVSGLQTKTTTFSRSRGYATVAASHTVSPSGFGLGGDLQLQGVPNYKRVTQTIRRCQSKRKGR